MMKLNSFLGILQLSFGVFLMTTMFLTLGMYSCLSNMFIWRNADNKLSVIVVVFFTMFMTAIWIYASNGAYNDGHPPETIRRALRLWSIFLIFWLILSLTSNIQRVNTYVCVNGNCPESLWMYNSSWRENTVHEIKSLSGLFMLNDQSNMTRDDEATISKVMWTEFSDLRNKTQTINNYNSNDKPILLQEPKPIKQHDQKSDSEIDINLIIVIFYVTFFMIIFGYGWFLLYSYHMDLKCRPPICPEKEEFSLQYPDDCDE